MCAGDGGLVGDTLAIGLDPGPGHVSWPQFMDIDMGLATDLGPCHYFL